MCQTGGHPDVWDVPGWDGWETLKVSLPVGYTSGELVFPVGIPEFSS